MYYPLFMRYVRREKGEIAKVSRLLTRKDLGCKLRTLRQDASLTQEALAEKVGVSTQQIQKYESGRDNISTDKLQQFAEVFSVPVQEFFSETSEVLPLEVSERVLLDSFREIENADIRESILKLTIHAAKVRE
jgi:transcriptional regulator with XRE-family HTH domain